jgi:SAM-dependent methyltransferase
MPHTQPFDKHRDRYEEWFTRFPMAFESELWAIRGLLPDGRGVEIGVGTGIFASRLGITDGIEPSAAMADLAKKRGIRVHCGIAEKLPYSDYCFDYALMVTTICFVDDPLSAIHEMARVVRPGGMLVVAFVDRESPLGKKYSLHKEQNVFYRYATFYSALDICHLLENENLKITHIRQTVFGEPGSIRSLQRSKDGHGDGGFVVIAAQVPILEREKR